MIYTYKCEACDTRFEKTLKMADMDQPLSEPCPECEAEGQVKKIIAGVPPLIDPVNAGRVRVNSDLRNKLEKIQKDYKGSNVNPHGMDR